MWKKLLPRVEKMYELLPRSDSHHFTIHVINTHHLKGNQLVGEYIGRGSLLGNPFSHMKGTTAKFLVRTREEAVNLYEKALAGAIKRGAPVTMGELKRLADIAKTRPLELRCYCSPKSCHGDVIKRFIENYLERGDWLHEA